VRIHHLVVLVGVLVGVLGGVTGCATGPGGPAVDGPDGPLHGAWHLTSGTGPDGEVPLGPGVEVTLAIDVEEWSGTVCNTYGAEVDVTDDGQVGVRGDGIRRTEMACPDPRVMDAEVTYLDALALVTAWRVEDDVLTLTGDDVTLTFDRVPATPDAELTGTVWTVETIVEGSGPDAPASPPLDEATLTLGEDDRFELQGVCNSGGGDHEVVDGRLEIAAETFSMTEIGCDAPLLAQDEDLARILNGSPTLEVVGDQLTVTAEAGQLLLRATP
jgi:heat shock protein HslJ